MRFSDIIREEVTGYDPRQLELLPLADKTLAERVAHQLVKTPYFADFLERPHKWEYMFPAILAVVSNFFNSMWQNNKDAHFNNKAMVESISQVWPYNGECYRIIGMSLTTIPSHLIGKYPTLKAMIDGKFVAGDKQAQEEFRSFLMSIQHAPFSSWSKTMDGINYFDQTRYSHSRNVIYKAKMQNGLDFQSMCETLGEIGIIPKDNRYKSTIAVEEVVGPVVNVELIHSKMIKFYRDDTPYAYKIDGKKYNFTDKGTLKRVGSSKR